MTDRALTWSYGGGTQSIAIAVLIAQGKLPRPECIVIADSLKGELALPVFTKKGALPTFCSTEWKSRVIQRWLREQGYGPERPVRTWIGISLDESRVRVSRLGWQQLGYPLIWDYPLRRSGCYAIVEAAGLPPPPKSSCWMCPFRRNEQWRRLRDHSPKDWESACDLDEKIRAKDIEAGNQGVWLHDSRMPLRDAPIDEEEPNQLSLYPEINGCGSGMCWV